MRMMTLAPMALALIVVAPSALAAGTDEAQIRALEARFAAAVNARNLDRIMAVYAPDVFVFDVVPPRQYVGADAYRADWKDFLAHYVGAVKFTVADLKVSVSGTMAWSHSIQTVVGQDAKGAPSSLVARVTDVYRRTAAGWRVVHEHVSAPIDLETGKPDLTSAP